MPRPKIRRQIHRKPGVTLFKPQGVPAHALELIDLTLDEYEALRLADYEELDQVDAAAKMKVSRSTFQRLITSARKKVAIALTKGKALQIHEVIDFNFPQRWGRRGRRMRRGR